MFRFFRVVVLASLVSVPGGAWAEEEGAVRAGRVMTWVPPYAVEECKKRLSESFEGVGMKDGLTHLGLQFWNPTKDGGIEVVSRFKEIDEAKISEFREWGQAHGVQVMLCVYNGTSSGWDWDLARSAFDTHRTKFVEALVGETLRLKLDGVDIDLEGEGDLEGSKEAFVRFIRELSGRLHAEGKELTVDTFAYKWHAPRQSWWPELLPHIDGLHVMGYSETGAKAEEWRSYESLKAAAGPHGSKLLLGMSGNASRWQESGLEEHLGWVVEDGAVGLAIWDARLSDREWRTKKIWLEIGKVRGGD